jgi:hypothetical protein
LPIYLNSPQGNSPQPKNHLSAYDAVCAPVKEGYTASYEQVGDPRKAAERIVDLGKGEGFASGMKLPARLALGDDALQELKKSYEGRLETAGKWQPWITGTNFD